MTNVFDDSWPIAAQMEIGRLRKENASYRIQRNKLREELDALQGDRPEGLLTLPQTLDAVGGDK